MVFIMFLYVIVHDCELCVDLSLFMFLNRLQEEQLLYSKQTKHFWKNSNILTKISSLSLVDNFHSR